MQNLLQNLQARFDQFAEREKLIIILGAAALCIIVFYFGFWQPSQTRTAFLKTEIILLQEDVNWMQANKQRVSSSGSTVAGAGLNRSLLALLDEQFKSAGLFEHVVSIQRDGNTRASVRLDNAPFDNVLPIIATLESNFNTLITRTNIQRTDETGRISGTLVFDRR